MEKKKLQGEFFEGKVTQAELEILIQVHTLRGLIREVAERNFRKILSKREPVNSNYVNKRIPYSASLTFCAKCTVFEAHPIIVLRQLWKIRCFTFRIRFNILEHFNGITASSNLNFISL